MAPLPRVELQAEVGTPRPVLFELVATADGLARWLDAAELEAEVGGAWRFTLRGAVAAGTVVALSPPQHISFAWDWDGEPLGVSSILAFDLIDHGARTHLTLRHVGFPSAAQRDLHDALWHHWFDRLLAVAGSLGREITS